MSALTVVPSAAVESRAVTMEVLAVKEVEVCPGGYESDCDGSVSGDCDGSTVLQKLSCLKRNYLSETYELELQPQDDVETQKVELTGDMAHALSRPLGTVPLRRSYVGLLVLYLRGEFESVTVDRCEDMDSPPPRRRKTYNMGGDSRWFYHCSARPFLPYNAVEWNIQLGDSAIVFQFMPEKDP